MNWDFSFKVNFIGILRFFTAIIYKMTLGFIFKNILL